ncbi:MAG TPA: YceI family protein [Bacteroidia bacterium]|jgi:polyisoprenoid-binding protein YceI|nr:YceI family protein [Bacteroidia bacterium]
MTNEIKWLIDQAHSEIAFKARHLMIAHVKGTFKTFDASIYTTGKDFKTAVIDLWIDVASITTGDEKRDEHLKGVDFFDVQAHKQITFTSSTIGAAGSNGRHELWGELTMKGITKNIQLNVEFGGTMKDPWGNEKAGFTVTGKIKRSDWGLTWNTTIEAGGLMVGDEIAISCEVELINAGEKELTMELDTEISKKSIINRP